MTQPLVSICVPNLNKRRFLEERMETLLAQTFTDWEMIVCDSYSDDGSWELLQKFKSDPRIRLYQVPRHGLYAGWNECLRRARGEYINIATSDDTATPQLLERVVEPLEKRSELHISVCNFSDIDEHSKQLAPRQHRHYDVLGRWLHTQSVRNGRTEFLMHAVCTTSWITMAAVLFRRSLLEQAGLFPTDFGAYGDIVWSLRASLLSDIAFVPDDLTTFRISEAQATPKNKLRRDFELDCRTLASVLDDGTSAIPEEWKKLDDWKGRIKEPRQQLLREYLHEFGLYRWKLRSEPRNFFSGVAKAWRDDRQWLFEQAVRGFPVRGDDWWRDEGPQVHVKWFNDLVQFFGAEWPPREVCHW
jgi:glycosyltransferase involved in cell wall biosynthesis